MTNKAVSYCQIAVKIRDFTRGDGLIPSIQNGKAKAVIYSSAIGANSKKKILNKCSTYKVPVYEMDASQFETIHPSIHTSIGITNANLAEKIEEVLK